MASGSLTTADASGVVAQGILGMRNGRMHAQSISLQGPQAATDVFSENGCANSSVWSHRVVTSTPSTASVPQRGNYPRLPSNVM